MFHRRLTLFLLLFTSAALGQTTSGNLAFEVATVKPSVPLDMARIVADMQAGKMPKIGPHVDGSRAEYLNMSLKELIANAYQVKGYQITCPAWLASARFDIVARMPEGAGKDDAPKMLQKLLEERFKLTLHPVTQDHPVLALVVGKDGPKMKGSPAPSPPVDENAPLKPGEMKMDVPDGPVRMTQNADGSSTINMGAKGVITQRMDPQSQTLQIESSTVTMAGLADMLTSLMKASGSQVVDMTEIKGSYQVAVEIPLADLMKMAQEQAREMGMSVPMVPASGGDTDGSPASAASDPARGSTIYTSVQKLGLKLVERKVQVKQLVIDHVERVPTEN